MIKISKATKKDSLDEEWQLCNAARYGKSVNWIVKPFMFKAEENGKLIGTIDGKYESGVIYISSLITAKTSRGKGVGTRLVNKAEEFGKKLEAHKIWLVTGKKWSENIFYKKLGFELIGELPDFYFHKDFVVYSKTIK
ncbi:MAG: GNAT family N-acetyltransferase [Candidatus Dojkabacteria bacterium]|nr:GNAT family N-acetyltransferase [Candidatus Dojkabacteria bacterium]